MITERRVRRWVRELRAGRRSVSAVVREFQRLPIDSLGVARLDLHRRLRRGCPEVVLCDGKTDAQLAAIAARFARHRELLLLTRLDPARAERLRAQVPGLSYHPLARLGVWRPTTRAPRRGLAVVATGGTSDVPVAEEAALTLEALGSRAARLYDVGVAGLHRVLSAQALLQRARAVVVVAGMEGALASVVGGLVRCPVIAVPTSVGYGANFAGVAPLLTMMNSCVPGVGVVNIDNGFGAGYLAHLINAPPHGRA